MKRRNILKKRGVKVEDIKYALKWGETLTERLKEAGYKNISKKDLKDIEDIYQVGPKRITYLEEYLDWKVKYGENLIHMDYEKEIYKIDDKIRINFRNEHHNGVDIFAVEGWVKEDSTVVEGILKFLYQEQVFEYDILGKGNTVGMTKPNGKPVILSKYMVQFLQKVIRIIRTREGKIYK
jgi:hypothetical protein